MSHTVTITRLPDEQSDDYEYTFGGTHDHTCAVGMRCERESCQARDHEEESERTAHGLDHWWNWDNREWIVQDPDACALSHVFEHVTEDETFDGLSVGTYPVLVMWEDSWWLEVQSTPITEKGTE